MYTQQIQIPGTIPVPRFTVPPTYPPVQTITRTFVPLPTMQPTFPQIPRPNVTIPQSPVIRPNVTIPQSPVIRPNVTMPTITQAPIITQLPIPTINQVVRPTVPIPQTRIQQLPFPTIPTIPQVPRVTMALPTQTNIPTLLQVPRVTVAQPTQTNIPRLPVVINTNITTPKVPVVINTNITTPRVPVVTNNIQRPVIPKVPVVTTNNIQQPVIPKVPVITTNNTTTPRVPVVTNNIQPNIVIPPLITTPRVPTLSPVITQPNINTPPRVNTPPRINTPPRVNTQPVQDAPIVIPQVDSPAETFVDIVIAEQDADIMDEKEYLGYVKYLLNNQSKYDIFTRIFPNNTCPGVIFRMDTERSRYPTIRPSERNFIECIKNKETTGTSIAINFSYENHANLLWFDTLNRVINRYDPQVAGDAHGQAIMDDTIRTYLSDRFPEYVYLGNTLETWQCVQGVRGEGRNYKSDYYCQDYSLLYAINRINGMSHEEAAFALVSRGEDVLIDLAELLRALAYKIRAEMGRQVPERFTEWNPQITL